MSFQSAIDSLKVSGKRVLVIGLGISGIESSKFLVRHGLKVLLVEKQPEAAFMSKSKFAPFAAELRALGVDLRFGVDGEAAAPLLSDVGLAILSPGVPLESAVVGTITRLKVPYVSELELGIELHGGRSIVVTGSNGKSTTVSLIDHIMRVAGVKSYLCGNVGTPVISSSELGSETASNRSVLVVEASSYQLEACTVLKPAVSVILNLSENHLERHGSMERYGAAKARCLRLQDSSDTAVINADDPAVMGMARSARASLSLFGRKPLEELLKGARNAASIDESGPTGPVIRASIDGAIEVYATSRSALLGAHNRANVAAAVLAARAMGVAPAAIQVAIDTFAPLEHRLEVVSRDGGRVIINDSKSTTVAASLAAFGTIRGHFPEHKIVLMLGGLSKAGSWDPLLKAVAAEKRAIEPVVCFGKDGPLLAGHCRASGVPCVVASTLREGTTAALQALQSVERGIVLLTPGCASFDEFTDFEHRGAQFKSYVAGARAVPLSA